jgi:competence protein ComEC
VLQIGPPDNRILLTGDIEKGAERRLVEGYGPGLGARFLVVPHHGSKTSSSIGFLNAVRPEYALIPAGYRNRFKLPAADIILRYVDAGIRQLNTAQEGAISLQLDMIGDLDAPKSYRQENLRYWHWRPVTLSR